MLTLPTNDAVVPEDLALGLIEVPDEVFHAEGMITPGERTLLYRLAKEKYTGQGAIVDAGMFLGASTTAFGRGLLDRPDAEKIIEQAKQQKPIQGYELGKVIGPESAQGEPRRLGNATFTVGEDFSGRLAKNIEPYADLVDTHIGDLLGYKWQANRPIEICFIDVAKTAELNAHVFKQFFPAFIPGVTLLVQQDYYFDRLPWIKVLMGHLKDHFEPIAQVGPTGLFRCISSIPKHKLKIDPYTDLSGSEQISLHGKMSLNMPLDRHKLDIQLSELDLSASRLPIESAIERLRRIASSYNDLFDPNERTSNHGLLTPMGRVERAVRLITQDFRASNRNADAVRLAEVAVELFPEHPKLQHRLGLLYPCVGRIDEAIEAHRQALKLRPDFKPAQQALDRALERRNSANGPKRRNQQAGAGVKSTKIKPIGLRRRLELIRAAIVGYEPQSDIDHRSPEN